MIKVFCQVSIVLFFLGMMGVLSCGPEMDPTSGCGLMGDQEGQNGVCGTGTYWDQKVGRCMPAVALCGPGTAYNSQTGKCQAQYGTPQGSPSGYPYGY